MDKKWWKIGLLFLTAAALVFISAALFYVSDIIKNNLNDNPEENETDKLILGSENNYWLGSPYSKITIVEFGDYACSFCKEFFPKIREISLKYKEDVKIVFRDYPVVSEHSASLSLAARCAGEQGLFWVMHDKLFLNQGVSQREEIIELANQIGANTDKFTYCLDNKIYLSDIQKDLDDGNQLELIGTPTVFIEGEKFSGDIPYDYLTQTIDKLLNEKP